MQNLEATLASRSAWQEAEGKLDPGKAQELRSMAQPRPQFSQLHMGL